jgi:AraC-like DNA-binding protein
VQLLASKPHSNISSFLRWFKKAAYNKSLEYIQSVKIEVVMKQFENKAKTISEVLYFIGNDDEKHLNNISKAFRSLFKRLLETI